MISYLTSDIFLQEIFSHFSVKSIDSYYYTLSFLSKNNFFLSLRELQKLLDAHKSISLKTTMDYIDFSLQAKIIKKVPLFDLKLNKEITTQSKFFFTDL
jgi:predicted AAA+ superfamily ATPase